jgi:hypothetical protein
MPPSPCSSFTSPKKHGGGAKVKSFDATKAKQVRGVIDVVQVPRGIAVVADNSWAAFQGKAALTERAFSPSPTPPASAGNPAQSASRPPEGHPSPFSVDEWPRFGYNRSSAVPGSLRASSRPDVLAARP